MYTDSDCDEYEYESDNSCNYDLSNVKINQSTYINVKQRTFNLGNGQPVNILEHFENIKQVNNICISFYLFFGQKLYNEFNKNNELLLLTLKIIKWVHTNSDKTLSDIIEEFKSEHLFVITCMKYNNYIYAIVNFTEYFSNQ